MQKKGISKWLAGVLAGAVAFTGIPVNNVSAAETTAELLADFNFNSAATDNVFSGGKAIANAKGSYSLEKLSTTDSALYLDGTDSYLDLTAANGDALLAGKENITISYDAKADKGSKSWSFFAAPDATKQTYLKEHYFGVGQTTTKVTVERYHNSGARPDNSLSGTVTSDWQHVDILISETNTALYINGTKVQESDSDYKLSDILGTEGGVVQVGKGNWDAGEYYKGLIDNYKIYDGILTQDEITAQYQEFVAAQEAIASGSEELKLEQDYDALTLVDTDDVRGNLPLVRTGKNGSTIEWTSSNTAVITDTADGGLYDGGVVTRPAAGSDPVTVKLTATITYGSFEPKTKEFTVTVQPKTANLDTDYSAGYLWTNFGTEDGYEKIFLGYSEDGLTWSKLNKVDGVAKSILTNDAKGSDLGVRDPHLIRSVDGDKYWILGTDLHAEGGGAGGSGWNQLSASKNLVVWESTDLVNWSEPRLVYAGFDTAGCVWAPEAIYDDTTGDYVVYWSARDYSKQDTEENALRVYVCRTRDFNTFSEPKVWLSEDQDSGTEVNIIDTTIVKDNGKFYRFSTSDWNTVIDVSDKLDTGDVLDVRTSEDASTPSGSWKRLVKRSGSSDAGFDSREGFTVYQLPDGKWCAMGDHSGYKAFVTDDLSSGKFTEATADFVDGKFRHGTVVRLSKAEEAAVLEAYKARQSEGLDEKEAEEPVLEYTFEDEADNITITDTGSGSDTTWNGTLFGNAKVTYDKTKKSNVLYLDGTDGTYAEIPQGFFDKRNTMTISMDVKSEKDSGNFFTFTYGQNSTYYNFLRVRGTEIRDAITTTSYSSEQEVKGSGAATGTWQNVVLVVDGTTLKLYVDGSLVSENTNTQITTASLGENLLAYLGKSMYSGDAYFKGSFDNFKVYNRALDETEILDNVIDKVALLKSAVIGTTPEDPSTTMGTDDHTAISSKIDTDKKEITSWVKKSANRAAIPVTLNLLTKNVTATINGQPFVNGSTVDLTKDAVVSVALADRTETYTIKTPKLAGNAVLPGQYADPDIDYFEGKYWIYPTTDGYAGWSGEVFHAWSSDDMIDWVDEGVILDTKDKDPGTNANGVDIAASAWSDGSAWAPTIEEKDGKYYFYYCGNVNSSYTGTCGSGKAIGVAVADNPEGPFTAKETPIVYPSMVNNAGIGFSGQVIDPSIFTDDDGTSYLFFGNGGNGCAFAELEDDMMTIKAGTLKKITGMKDFRESVVVMKRNGLYHFTWSCDDTGSPNYHVNYGIAEKLDGNVTYKYTLLAKDTDNGILGTAHQSLLYMPDTDKCYIAYHRFYTPLGIYTSGLGYHRETCIDEVTFDEETGLMNPVTPTMEGVGVRASDEETATINANAAKAVMEKIQAIGTVSFSADSKAKIDAARAAYNALTAEQKALVTNASVLTAAEAEYQKLVNSKDQTTSGDNNNSTIVQPAVPDTVVATAPTAESIIKNNSGLPGGKAEESKNSTYAALSAKVSKSAKNSNKVQWTKVKDADGYVVFGNLANAGKKKYAVQVLSIIENNSTTSYTHTKLKKGTAYKYIVQAYKMVDGKAQILATSKTVYAATKGGKDGNVTSLKAKSKVSLKKGKKTTLKVTAKKSGKNFAKYRKIAFESGNTKIATVTNKGVIKGKKKGTCYIYVYAQNGISKKVKVTVK